MSLTFTGGDSDKVNHGSDSSGETDDLDDYTVLLWVYPTTLTPGAARMLCQKGTEPGQRIFQIDSSNNLYAELHGGNSTQAAFGNFTHAAVNTWMFWVQNLYQAGASTDQRLFVGNLDNPPEEPSSYAGRGVGTAPSSNASADLIVGNHPSQNFSFPGDIAACWIYSPRLGDGEILAQWENPWGVINADCKFFAHYGFGSGAGSQPDWSGNGNDGTVTGATASDHPPLWQRPAQTDFYAQTRDFGKSIYINHSKYVPPDIEIW